MKWLKESTPNFLCALLVLVVFLVFAYLFYSIDSSNKYVDSILKNNYYQGKELNEHLTERINNEFDSLIRKKIEEDELYAIISFHKTASKVDTFVNIFGVVSVLFLGIIGLKIWDSKRDKEESRQILIEMKKTAKESRAELTKVRRVRSEASRLVDRIGFKHRAIRFENEK